MVTSSTHTKPSYLTSSPGLLIKRSGDKATSYHAIKFCLGRTLTWTRCKSQPKTSTSSFYKIPRKFFCICSSIFSSSQSSQVELVASCRLATLVANWIAGGVVEDFLFLGIWYRRDGDAVHVGVFTARWLESPTLFVKVWFYGLFPQICKHSSTTTALEPRKVAFFVGNKITQR